MKQKVFTFAAACLLAPYARAADRADLMVTGEITPSSCNVSLRDGVLNLGTISAADLSETEPTNYVDKENKLEITCDGPARFTFKARDLANGGGNGRESFGLGRGSNDKAIGHFLISERHDGFRVDGKEAYLTASEDGQAWTESSSSPMPFSQSDYVLGLSRTKGSSSGPDFVQRATIWLFIPVVIAPKVDLVLEDELALAGNVSFEITYF